MQEC